MFKQTLLMLLLAAFFSEKANAQKQNPQSCRSQLYVSGLQPAHNILVLYRRELFTRKGFEQLANILTDSCEKKKVHIEFAVQGSSKAEELAEKSDLICRLNSTELMDNQLYQVRPGEFRKSLLHGSGSLGLSLLAFTKTDRENPAWKCNCNLLSGLGYNAEKDAAKFFFTHLAEDGLIK